MVKAFIPQARGSPMATRLNIRHFCIMQHGSWLNNCTSALSAPLTINAILAFLKAARLGNVTAFCQGSVLICLRHLDKKLIKVLECPSSSDWQDFHQPLWSGVERSNSLSKDTERGTLVTSLQYGHLLGPVNLFVYIPMEKKRSVRRQSQIPSCPQALVKAIFT